MKVTQAEHLPSLDGVKDKKTSLWWKPAEVYFNFLSTE